MLPHVAPPIWPDPAPRPGRFAATIVRNAPELSEDRGAQAELAKCKVALIGLPDDTGVVLNHGRPGARAGPAAFRAALAKYGVASPADEPEQAPAYPRVFDAGDVIPGGDLHQTHDRVSEAVLILLERGLFPIAIGGGHDLTFAFVRGVARAFGALDGVYFDAHLDVRSEPGSGMPFRALLDGGWANSLSVIGLNAMVNSREHMDYFRSKGGVVLAPSQFSGATVGRRSSFVSLDLDCMDGAYAPGVSAVNPCGMSPQQCTELVMMASRTPTVRCFDIMELNPDVDDHGRTARLAVHLFLTFLRGLAERGPNLT